MVMTVDEVRERLAVATADAGSPGTWAKQHGISAAYVSDVMNKRRDPGEKILTALRIEKVVLYRDAAP